MDLEGASEQGGRTGICDLVWVAESIEINYEFSAITSYKVW